MLRDDIKFHFRRTTSGGLSTAAAGKEASEAGSATESAPPNAAQTPALAPAVSTTPTSAGGSKQSGSIELPKAIPSSLIICPLDRAKSRLGGVNLSLPAAIPLEAASCRVVELSSWVEPS